MPEGVQQISETVLRVTGASAFRSGMNLAAGAASMAGRAISTVIGAINPLNTLMAGLSFGVAAHEIASLGSQFENTRRLIAGTFATMGAAGDFNAGLTMASTTMDQIAIAAARLPGEAEDYISVFQSGLPVLLQSMHGSMTDITDFSNRFTAIMSTLGVSSQEAGMMINRALAAGRGGLDQQSMAARRLMPFITQATAGTAHQVTSIAQFNALSQEQRQQVLQTTLAQEGLNSMLEDAGSSWDAQTGALSSALQMMTRMGTAPLFDAMKDGLAQVNALLMDANGHWTVMGQRIINAGEMISTNIVAGIGNITAAASQAGALVQRGMAGEGTGASGWDSEARQRTSATGDPAQDAMLHFGGILTTLGSVLEPIVGLLETLQAAMQPAIAVTMALVGGIDTLLEPVALLVTGVVSVASMIIEGLTPAFTALWEGAASLITGITDFLNPILRILVIGLIAVVDVVSEMLTPLFNVLGEAIGWVMDELGQLLSALGAWIAEISNVDATQRHVEEVMGGEHSALGGMLQGMLDSLDDTSDTADTAASAERSAASRAATPHARGGGHTTQDFRFSRFDISQRFEEGFDPDRVAVAFADDLGRVGERRLQSAQAPLFSVR